MADDIDGLIGELTGSSADSFDGSSWIGTPLSERTQAESGRALSDVSPNPKPVGVAESDTGESKRRLAPILLIALLAFAVVGLAGYFIGARSSDDTDVATVPDEVASPSTTSPAASSELEDAAQEEPEVVTTATTVAAAEGESTEAAAADEEPPWNDGTVVPTEENPEGAIVYSVVENGSYRLEGYMPSREEADSIIAGLGEVVGIENIVDNYVIDPNRPDITEDIVYVKDAIYFELGSAVLASEFYPLLDNAPAYLELNPGRTITVVARTDASGSATYNRQLAEDRAQAVIDYYISIGVNPDQVKARALGEDEAVETDDNEQAALQRRVDFILAGPLGSE